MQLKQLTALAACALFLTGSALAQEPPERPNRRPSPDEAVTAILDLSDAQLQELKDLRNSVNEQRREHVMEMRRLQQGQRELLQQSPPDAVALGNILVQQQNLRQQIQDENTAFRDTALTLLTASQREKVEQVQEALQLVRAAPPLAQFGLIEGPRGHGGRGGPADFGGPGFIGRGGGRFRGQFEAPPPQQP